MGVKEEQPDCQRQFEAAVRVIQSLPKSGSYRPSYEEMLRFYSYYKQATVGQCHIPRPGFWDPIGRYKWDAWNSLGKMTKEEAMTAYIAEMKKAAQKVINTIPMDETSEEMFVHFEPLYEVIHDMPRPPESFFKKKPGQMGAESTCLQNGPLSGLAEHCPDQPTWSEHKEADPPEKAVKSSSVASDSEGEVFCDSLEHVELEQTKRPSAKEAFPLDNLQKDQDGEKSQQMLPGQGPFSEDSPGPEASSEIQAGPLTQQKMDRQVISTIQALQEDMKNVMERLSYLESWVASQGSTSTGNPSQPAFGLNEKEGPRRPAHLSPGSTWIFLLAWPFIVQWLLWCFQRQKR